MKTALQWKRLLTMCILLIFLSLGVACSSAAVQTVTFQAENRNVKLGAEVDWTEGVSAKTADGESVSVTVDASRVDMRKAGAYPIVYSAGNYYVERVVRVYAEPVIYYAGRAVSDGETFEMTYSELIGMRGFTSGFTAKDCFGVALTVEAEAPAFTGGAGPFAVTWKTRDAAGNVLALNGSVILDESKFPSAQNAEYDFSQEYAFVCANAKGGDRVFLYEGENKINMNYYEQTSDGFRISGAYFSKGETGVRSLRLVTEYGEAEFTVSVTDSQPPKLQNISQMDGYVFSEGEPVRIDLPKRLIFGYQQVRTQFICDTMQFKLNSESFSADSAPVGEHCVTIRATGKNGTTEDSFTVRVLTAEKFLENYGPGTANQFEERFFVDVNSGVKFGFERKNADVYGYRMQTPGVSAWNQRLEMSLTSSEIDVSAYDTLKAEVYVNNGKPTFPFMVLDKKDGGAHYIPYSFCDLQLGQFVNAADIRQDRWYRISAVVPADADAFQKVYLIFTGDNEAADIFIRGVEFCRSDSAFSPNTGSSASVVCEETDVFGRTGVTKYVSTAGAWGSRVQWTKKSYAEYNALMQRGGGKFAFDVCTAGDFNLQFWYVAADGGMKDFTSSSAPIAVWKDAQGKTVAPENIEQNVWYTLEIDLNALGALGVSTGGDRCLQVAANSETGGVFYWNNARFFLVA